MPTKGETKPSDELAAALVGIVRAGKAARRALIDRGAGIAKTALETAGRVVDAAAE